MNTETHTEKQQQLIYRMALTLIPNIGSVLAKNLVSYCGSVEAVFKEKRGMLEKVPGIGTVLAGCVAGFKEFDRAEQELRFIEENDVKPVFFLDTDYPQRLRHCIDSPVMLYTRGAGNLNAEKMVAVVGTRNATTHGREMCEQLVEGLAVAGVTVISGLAYGIDITAHKTAVKHNMPTWGVVAHGLDRLYPAIHKPVVKSMYSLGGLITEYMSETNPDAENFPSRNRIIAGMADATIVVEAAITGGALITGEIANSYNRDVFAVPGRTNDLYSAGCNHFIRTNRAALIRSAEDVLYSMSWDITLAKPTCKSIQKQLLINLTEDEQTLVNLMNAEQALPMDVICARAEWPSSKVASTLLTLEFAGIVRALPGKMFQLT